MSSRRISTATRVLGEALRISRMQAAKWLAPPSGTSSRSTEVSTT